MRALHLVRRGGLVATAVALMVVPVLQTAEVSALAGARSSVNGTTGDVFLGGDYIEVGVSRAGSFGTDGNAPGGFFGTAARTRIGMSTNPTGFGVAPDLRMDFFMPGSPEERWSVGYTLSGTQVAGSNALLRGATDISDNVVTDESSGTKLQARSIGTFNSRLQVTQVVSFNVSEKFFRNEVTLKNVGADPLTSVRYMRSFDPDNTVDQGGEYETRNYIPKTHAAGDGAAVVVADTSLNNSDPVYQANGSRSPILFYSSDERARVSTFGFSNGNPYAASAYDAALPKGTSIDDDQAITIATDVGALSPGSSQTFVYYTSLDNRDFEEVLQDIGNQETPGPTIAGPNNGDGNGDGTPDSEQPHVQYVSNPVAGDGHYVTLQTVGCGTIESLGLKDARDYGPDNQYIYPLGLVDFEVTCANPGDTTTVTLFYDEAYDTASWTARKYINGAFIPVPGASFGTAMVGGRPVTTLTYQITDGGELDADGQVNGTIIDPAGPAVLVPAAAPSTGFSRQYMPLIVISLVAGSVITIRYASKAIRRTTA